MSWQSLPLGALFERIEERGRPDLPLLSVYRDLGVVPRAGRSDNFNRPSDDLASYKVVRPGDLVLNKMKTWQGSLGVSDHEGIVSPAYFIGRARPTIEFDRRFLHHLVRSGPMIAQYGARSKGIRPSQWDLPWDEFKSIRIRLPAQDEQRAIADYLDTETAHIDDLITKKRRMIELLAEEAAARTEQIIWSGTHPAVPLKRLVPTSRKIMYGIVLPGPNVDDGALLVKGGDTKEGRLDPRLLARTDFAIEAKYVRSRVRAGDLLFAIRGGVGDVEIAPPSIEGANITQDVARISPNADVDGRWLLHALRSLSAQRDVANRITGATIRGINIEELDQVQVPVPSLAVQKELAKRLEIRHAVSSGTTTRLRNQIELLQERRQALITAAVTGELEIPGVAA